MDEKEVKSLKDFNEKYKDYLEEGHYGLSFEGEEFLKFLDDLFKELIKFPGFKYSQIKIKWGGIRFYSTLGPKLTTLIEVALEEML